MSAAELLTGALQDRGRAVVVGSRTFGKGSVQMPSRLPDGSVAELTVGHYRTPSGRGVDGRGITPGPGDGRAGPPAGGDRSERPGPRAVNRLPADPLRSAKMGGTMSKGMYVPKESQPKQGSGTAKAKDGKRKLVAQNKKARHDYAIIDTYEAGLVLTGTEVKSLRQGRASLTDGFVQIDGNEAWLHNAHIPEYSQGSWTNHSARRKRKLLLHREEIDKLESKSEETGHTTNCSRSARTSGATTRWTRRSAPCSWRAATRCPARSPASAGG